METDFCEKNSHTKIVAEQFSLAFSPNPTGKRGKGRTFTSNRYTYVRYILYKGVGRNLRSFYVKRLVVVNNNKQLLMKRLH